MSYVAPSLDEMVALVSNDLRDSQHLTFSVDSVEELINWGIVEVNRVYPVMSIWSTEFSLDENNRYNTVIAAAEGLSEISRIELWRDLRYRDIVPQMGEAPNSGWDHFGNNIVLPTWLNIDADIDTLKVYGYFDRATVTDGDEALDVDAEAERAIRLYATSRGYQRLQNDRAMFQQWLNVPGNTDVSPTQLDSMANTYMADWERYRKHVRRLRR